MAKITEKRLFSVSPQLLIVDGGVDGSIIVSDTSLFVVGHILAISSSVVPSRLVQVKRIPNSSTLLVGDPGKPIQDRVDVSAYLVADGATVSASEQVRPTIPEQEIERLTYDEEPVIARRVVLVDKHGDKVDSSNPLPVDATLSASSADTPTIFNVDASIPGTEYSQVLPDGTVSFLVRARNNAKLNLSYIENATDTTYLTVMPGNIYIVESVRLTGRTIYFQANKSNTTVEIVTWS